MFSAEQLPGTPRDQIVKTPTPGGHIGLFMGSHTIKEVWPAIGQWMRTNGALG